MKKIFLLYFLFMYINTRAQMSTTVNIVPQPAELKVHAGTFPFDQSTVVIAGESTKHEAEMFNFYLKKLYGFSLAVKNKLANTKNEKAIILNLLTSNERKDASNLEVTSGKILISASGNEGIFYGIQTLLQLLPDRRSELVNRTFNIPQLSIKDFPRFQYRGMHLDVARHFFGVDFIKKYIDYLAFYKYNKFHWHLTDDQGWRIEIKKYPRLTTAGGFRNGTIIGRFPGTSNDSTRYGGFYTQEQIKEIVKYARDRFITVIPEIEMPGHSSAAIAAYPQLSCFPNESTKISNTPWAGSRNGKQVQQTWGVFEDVYCPSEYTFKFLENVLDEVMKLFPSKYIHIGGDECPKTNWQRSAFCQQLIKEEKLKDEHGLQSYFIQRIEKYLNSKGRNIIGWDEILEGGLAPNATVMSWRGEEGGIAAAKQKHQVIMTPGAYCYFDHSQTKNEDSITIGGYLPLEIVYNYEPVPKELNEEEAKYIMGAQANLWSEYITNPGKVEYMIFPRMAALSEVLWSPKENRNWNAFSSKLTDILKRYELWGANYSTAYYDLQSSVLPTPNYDGVLLKLESKFANSTVKYKSGDNPDWNIYSTPIWINSSINTASFLEVNGKKSNIITRNFSFNKATGKKISLKEQPSPNYPGSGAFTLVNGIITTKNLSESGEWLGFLGKDLEAEIDLGSPAKIQNVSLYVLDQNDSWIYLPKEIQIAVSDDGVIFSPISTKIVDQQKDKGTRKFTLPADTTTRFIRVTAKNLGIISAGLPGAGNPAWLFADEIVVQ